MASLHGELSVLSLAAANRANYFGMLLYAGRSPYADYRQGPPLTRMISRLPPTSMNVVLVDRVDAGEIEPAIADTLAHFEEQQVGAVSWWSRPGVDPLELGRRLAPHGMLWRDGEPGMVADLLALPESLPPPAGLTIEPVAGDDRLRQWVHAALAGFEAPAWFEPHMFDFYRSLGYELPLRNYLGLLDGKPVASSQVFVEDGVAGIYIVATVPEARGKGIGSFMTLAAMRDGRELGCRIATLQASDMGFPVYERLGFREVCRMSHWEWRGRPRGR